MAPNPENSSNLEHLALKGVDLVLFSNASDVLWHEYSSVND